MVFSEDNEQCNSCRGRLKTVPDVYKVALGIFMVYYNSIASLTCRLAEYKLSRAEKCDQIFSLTLVWSGGIILKRNRVKLRSLEEKWRPGGKDGGVDFHLIPNSNPLLNKNKQLTLLQ